MGTEIRLTPPEPREFALSRIIDKVEDGYIVIPRFQREFVWTPEATAKLFDSILKGYPIGTFTFWSTKVRLRMVSRLGGKKFRIAGSGNVLKYVLDGQQRITSIYACLKGITIDEYDYGNIVLRLGDESDGRGLVVHSVEGLERNEFISISDLFKGDIGLADRYPQKYRQKIKAYHDFLLEYRLSSIEVPETTLEVATDIFTRINTTGKKLTTYEILCAKVYDEKAGFDLIEKRERQRRAWETKGFGALSDMTVMQAMAICVKGSCKPKAMLDLTNKDFIGNWDRLDEAFGLAIDYLRGHMGVPSTKLLPYDVLLVPFVYYFFRKDRDRRMEAKHAKAMSNYFWRVVLSGYFVEGVQSKLDASVKYVDALCKGRRLPELPPVNISEEEIRNRGRFSFSSSYAKGFLCILAAKGPQTFDTGARIQLDGDWLSQSNSVNYHHFFPKDFMAKRHKEFAADEVNHVVNITIVDRYLNQNKIRARAPSSYIQDYQGRKLKSILETHLIGDLRQFGIKTDEYGKFFKRRVALFQKEFRKRLIDQKGDVLK